MYLELGSESPKESLELLPLPGLSVDAGLGSLGLRLRLDLSSRVVEGRDGGLEQTAINRRS